MKNKLMALTLVGTMCLGSTAFASTDITTTQHKDKAMLRTTEAVTTQYLDKVLYTHTTVEEKIYNIIANDIIVNLPEDTKQAFGNTKENIMVPLRVIAEALGYEVTWDGETNSVEMVAGNNWTKITIGYDSYFYGKTAPIPLGKAPEIINGRTFVPLGFVETVLQAPVTIENDILKITNIFKESLPTLSYNFDNDNQGFEFGFVDLPVNADTKDLYEIGFDYKEIPVIDKESNGLYLTGHNRSDDLFLYTYKEIGQDNNLKPNTKYNVNLSFSLATNVPGGMMGIGGSPGESVYVKAGTVNVKPASVIDDLNYYRFNLDKGNQASTGTDLKTIGNLVKSDESFDDSYSFKHFETSSFVETDADGNTWIVIGSDSGFEGKTEIYLDNVTVTYSEALN